jgi:L-ascorbate metabolism protein UlaG (beta-lactamase superfamily)
VIDLFINREKDSFKEYSTAPRIVDVLKWRIRDKLSKRLIDEDKVPSVRVDTDLLKREMNYLLWVGHSTVLINVNGKKILLDPVFSNRLLTMKRVSPIDFSIKDLTPIDYVLISHNHIDHLETDVLRILKDHPRYLIPLGLDYFMRRHRIKNYITFDWYECYREREIEFTFVPAQHWSQRGIFDRNKSLWGGWIIRTEGISFYFAGDTGYCDIFKRLRRIYGKVDMAMLPIGAYSPRWFSYKNHMSPYEALRAFGDLNSDFILPIHWGAFRLGQEGVIEPIRRLFSLWEKERIEDERLIFLPAGGVLSLPRMSKTAISSNSGV